LIPSASSDDVLSILAYFNLVIMEYSSLMTEVESKEFNIQLQKLLKTVEKEFMYEINKIEIKEILLILDNISRLGYDSKNFYSDVFHHIENMINANKVSPDYFYMVLDIYCRSNIQITKFVDFLIKKSIEAIPNINLENLSNLLRILFSIDQNKIEILDKAENFIIDNLDKINDNTLANFVFAYSNEEYKKIEIFSKFEEETFIRLDTICENKNFDSYIDLLYNFIYSKKSSSFIQNVMKEKLLAQPFKIDKLHSQSVLKLFNIFKALNIKYPITQYFEYFVCCSINQYNEEEMNELEEILIKLNYRGSKFYEEFFIKCKKENDPYSKMDIANNYIMQNISNN